MSPHTFSPEFGQNQNLECKSHASDGKKTMSSRGLGLHLMIISTGLTGSIQSCTHHSPRKEEAVFQRL